MTPVARGATACAEPTPELPPSKPGDFDFWTSHLKISRRWVKTPGAEDGDHFQGVTQLPTLAGVADSLR